eukprot:103964-Pleurochrysis_carterae.AAC.4
MVNERVRLRHCEAPAVSGAYPVIPLKGRGVRALHEGRQGQTGRDRSRMETFSRIQTLAVDSHRVVENHMLPHGSFTGFDSCCVYPSYPCLRGVNVFDEGDLRKDQRSGLQSPDHPPSPH